MFFLKEFNSIDFVFKSVGGFYGESLSFQWVLCIVFFMSLGLVYAVKKGCEFIGFYDIPNVRSAHVESMPTGGGVGFVLAFFLGAGAFFLGGVPAWGFVPAFLLFLTGVLDDYLYLNVWSRIALQVISALLVVLWGDLSIFKLGFSPYFIEVSFFWGAGLAVFFIVAMSNIYNFMDGIDGYAAGMSIISATAFYFAFSHVGFSSFAGLQLVLISSLLGFLVWNYPKAKIFMGDSGSLFLGFYFAVMSLFFDSATS